MNEAARAFLLLILGVMFMAGIGILGYGILMLVESTQSGRGESMSSQSLYGFGMLGTLIGGLLATVSGGLAYLALKPNPRRRR